MWVLGDSLAVQWVVGFVAGWVRRFPSGSRALVTFVAQVQVNPTAEGLPGGAMMQKLLNWGGQVALWGSVASVLAGAGVWGVSQQFGNGMQTGKGKTLAAAGAIGAVLTGLASIIVNTLFKAAG